MQVFISWSGPRSHAVAKELYAWLPLVLSGVEPWLSDENLGKGGRWALGLGEGLGEMNAGISVLTPENVTSPWLNFEAGAIGKAFGQSQVMTFLIGLSPTEVPQPLAQFQATRPTREDVLKMITDLNGLTTPPVKGEILTKQFNMWWPQLDEKLREVEQESPPGTPPKRSAENMLEEVLTLLREMARPTAASLAGIAGVNLSGTGTLSAGDDWTTWARQAVLRARGDFPSTTQGATAEKLKKVASNQASHIAVRAHREIAIALGRDSAKQVGMLYDPNTLVLIVVTGLPFPVELTEKLQALLEDSGIALEIQPPGELRMRKLPNYINLTPFLLLDQTDTDD